ncbi:hypothetical protein K438DRAFT_2017894 [Mycena galopus ATCC 62051]|nr:hypothetical protein K438DRAFT_2017894 [Mycena galopus ATCC 62051]
MDDSLDSANRLDSPPPLPKHTLVLPPLRDLKKASKNPNQSSRLRTLNIRTPLPPKVPRPIKLKPLKEVLGRLVLQLKKKDDYAFFLKPVNPSQVPGYSDLIKRPMDLGTMTVKVQRGRYRSLEDFADDFRLVTGNAKIFNPPGSIYHSEAERIEVWGLDQISEAASTVIQYETDWNIDDEDIMAVDAANMEERSRSPSVSLQGGENPTTAVDKIQIDAEGRLPGSKDGLGAFSPGSDLARMMFGLKLKVAVEDPFSFLSVLVPDPLTRPATPPHISAPTAFSISAPDTMRHANYTRAPPSQSYPLRLCDAPKKITGCPPGDEADDHARETHALDFGAFALLAGEMRRRGVPLPEGLEDADVILKGAVRDSLEIPVPAETGDSGGAVPPAFDLKKYWGTGQALGAEGYIRDVVYGGVDGLAYVRSLAEFVATPPLDIGEHMDAAPSLPLGTTLPAWVAQNVVGPLTEGRHALLQRTALELRSPMSVKPENDRIPTDDDKLPALVSAALHVRPRAAASQLHVQKIDMAALIHVPSELKQSETEWAGKGLAGSGPTEMNVVLDYVAGVICRLQAERDAPTVKQEEAVEGNENSPTGESAVVRNLQLNLLALVKRAPLDTIALLPVNLVPEHIRL